MEWINVKDRLPEKNQTVLISDGKEIHAAFYCNDIKGWMNCYYCSGYDPVIFDEKLKRGYLKAIYWMPLPKPPKD